MKMMHPSIQTIITKIPKYTTPRKVYQISTQKITFCMHWIIQMGVKAVMDLINHFIKRKMDKQIQMFEIGEGERNQVVGTQIFDADLPSSIDFEQQEENQHEKSFINPEKKISEMGKALVISNEMKSYRVGGKVKEDLKQQFMTGSAINHAVNTHPVKVLDHKSSGLKSLWDSLRGYCKREVMIQEGYLYFLQKKGNSLLLQSCLALSTIFKLFVDPEDEKIRLVIKQNGNLSNLDICPDNFITVIAMISQQMNACGLALVE